ncbi:MAG TPA: ABC transporter substrate-binding protein [Micromonosporaceae bacterium]
MSRGTSTLDRRQLLRIFGAVAAAGATGGLVACTSDTASQRGVKPSGLTIPVGLVVPTSGPFAGVGEDIKRGFTLFLETNNNLLGPHNIDLRIADEGKTPDSALAAVSGLMDQSVVAVAGIANPDALPGIALKAQDQRIPVVSSNAASGRLTNALYIWRAGAVLGDSGRALASYAKQQGSRTYVMYESSTSGQEEFDSFRTEFAQQLRGEIVQSPDELSSGQAEGSDNFPDRLTQAVNRGADSIFAAFSGDDAISLIKAYHDLRIGVKLLGTGSLTEAYDLTKIKALPQNVFTAMYYAPDLDNDANRRFVTGFHRKYGVQPSSYAMAGYDSAGVLDRALGQVPTGPNGPAINQAFSALGQIDSPRGTWTFNINRSPQQKWYLRHLALDGQVPSNLLDSNLAVLG